MTDQQYRELDFSVFLLYRLAEAWQKPVPETYQILDETNILGGYIFPCYDTLHTMGTEALVEDITEFAQERGAQL